MSSKTICRPFLLLLLTAGFNLHADVIDFYLPVQGPFTVGPGETISGEEGVVNSDDILGGFRFAAPAMSDLAAAGSTATMSTGGGSFTCAVRFPSGGNANNTGGCTTLYDRNDGPAFDLSGSTTFLFDVQDASGNPVMIVSVGDINNRFSIGQVPVVTAGQAMLPFNLMIPPANAGGADFSAIEFIDVVMGNSTGNDADLTLGHVFVESLVPPHAAAIVSSEKAGLFPVWAKDRRVLLKSLEKEGRRGSRHPGDDALRGWSAPNP